MIGSWVGPWTDSWTDVVAASYIRRTIKPALGTREVRKVRGPLLDHLYTRLLKCGNLACVSKLFTEHRRHVPDLSGLRGQAHTGRQSRPGDQPHRICCNGLTSL